MTRSTVIAAVRAYLAASYTGPVAIHPETGSEDLSPPYAVIRIGSAEELYPGTAEIWDMNILVAVFHDADATTPADAEANSEGVFTMFDDPDGLITSSADTLAWSSFERLGSEASVIENRWQHIAGFRGIVAPVEPEPPGD